MNRLLTTALFAWVLAQGCKLIFGWIRYGRQDRSRVFWRILWAGGMPSAHSAVVTSMTLVLFQSLGGHSPFFGFSVVMACIVIYDRKRMHTLYGQFQEKYPSLKKDAETDPVFKDLMGHRSSEILVGVLIGLISGYATLPWGAL